MSSLCVSRERARRFTFVTCKEGEKHICHHHHQLLKMAGKKSISIWKKKILIFYIGTFHVYFIFSDFFGLHLTFFVWERSWKKDFWKWDNSGLQFRAAHVVQPAIHSYSPATRGYFYLCFYDITLVTSTARRCYLSKKHQQGSFSAFEQLINAVDFQVKTVSVIVYFTTVLGHTNQASTE